MNVIRAIAMYLPQFHPIPENDVWWGTGFTEWTNVTRARPLFKGHYQPRLPAELGFYDLRLHEVREQQAALAQAYGVFGFCYYHYWFMGKRLLNRPVDDMLASGKPNFPFMLCWANETWSRRWLGEESEILIKQTYSDEDDHRHALWLCEHVFSDARYITVNRRPVFMFYRPADLPDCRRTIEIIKNTATRMGLPEPYIIGSNSHTQQLEGFDHILSFEPQLSELHGAFNDRSSLARWVSNLRRGIFSSRLKVYNYEYVKQVMASRRFPYRSLPCVFVGWDNSARRGNRAVIVVDQDVNIFKASLLRARDRVADYPEAEQLVFINAWNEWAEGNHLEPCQKYGRQFLSAVQEVFASN